MTQKTPPLSEKIRSLKNKGLYLFVFQDKGNMDFRFLTLKELCAQRKNEILLINLNLDNPLDLLLTENPALTKRFYLVGRTKHPLIATERWVELTQPCSFTEISLAMSGFLNRKTHSGIKTMVIDSVDCALAHNHLRVTTQFMSHLKKRLEEQDIACLGLSIDNEGSSRLIPKIIEFCTDCALFLDQ